MLFRSTLPGQSYAAKQIALAKDREPIVNKRVLADYLMQDPEQARILVRNNTAIPGVTASQSENILDGLRLQLAALDKQQAKDIAAAGAAGTGAARQRLGVVEEEERQALEAQRAEEERLAREAETERRVAPEVLALRRLGEGPTAEPTTPTVTKRPEGRLPIGDTRRPVRPEPPVTKGKLVSERLKSAQEALSEEEEPLGEDESVNKIGRAHV